MGQQASPIRYERDYELRSVCDWQFVLSRREFIGSMEQANEMKHAEKRMAGKYVPAFSWHRSIDDFLREVISEEPLLHVCSGPVSELGDMRVDRFVKPIPPGVIADWTDLPFGNDTFGAVFADPPWNLGYMKDCAEFCKEALRIAPVAYVMSPWLWVNSRAERTNIWVREFPGVNVPILLVRYQRANQQQQSLWVGTHP